MLATIRTIKNSEKERFILKKIILALVIAKPGHLRNGLQSLLRAIPQIEILAESSDPSVLLKMNKEMLPEMILVDASLVDETNWSTLTKIKAVCPSTNILVLTDNDQQGQAAREAGADFYLLKGFPASELAHIIETSLIRNPQDKSKQ